MRVAKYKGKLYLDLCNDAWQVVEVGVDGWHVIDRAPVFFRREKGMLPLPLPEPRGSLEELWELLNVAEEDWPLVGAWLIGSFMPDGPYPVLNLGGEQGSAKTTLARMLKSLVDPSMVNVRTVPKDEHDLIITATNSWVVAIDNINGLAPWLSDAICRLSTGGGFATRQLYTDSEEALFSAKRPIILNGIGEIATRSDLLDRAIVVSLPRIPDNKRRTEAELWAAADEAWPRILGALLTAVSAALANEGRTKLAVLPRMADFATWVCAACPALGFTREDFLNRYQENRQQVHELVLEASPVAGQVKALASKLGDGVEWSGTPTELLEKLNGQASDSVQHQKGWPKSASALSSKLKLVAPNLRAMGVTYSSGRAGSHNTQRRLITISREPTYVGNAGNESSSIPSVDKTEEIREGEPSAEQRTQGQISVPSVPPRLGGNASLGRRGAPEPRSNSGGSRFEESPDGSLACQTCQPQIVGVQRG